MRILFVCAGNTCRSPLAEAIARTAAQELGLDAVIVSAGLRASDGEPAAPYAIELAPDLAAHASRSVTRRLVEAQDVVFVMEPRQVEEVERLGGAGKTFLLDPPDGVEDPLPLGTRAAYARTRDRLEAAVAGALDRLPTPTPA